MLELYLVVVFIQNHGTVKPTMICFTEKFAVKGFGSELEFIQNGLGFHHMTEKRMILFHLITTNSVFF